MVPDAPHRPRLRHMASTGTALAVSLAPLVIGVLLAKSMAADPLTPVNALATRGGQAVPLSPAQWRGCGVRALRGRRGPLDGRRRAAARVRLRARTRRTRER
ncbi:hypothetical protein [Streptomyces sp. NPDC052042]|uniref:hypothetical protein n=1 Tax=Streptomyces sp. NPDC052042 TaxID=3365683 RepID=UPI0037D827CD